MSLNDWRKFGWLTDHQPTAVEIRDHFAVIDRDLADAQVESLSADWRLNIAYNAALQAATVALLACGFRASREAHHYRVIQSLAFTIGSPPKVIARFDVFRKKRNQGGYEQAGAVSDREAGEMLSLARTLASEVRGWLQEHHPALIEG